MWISPTPAATPPGSGSWLRSSQAVVGWMVASKRYDRVLTPRSCDYHTLHEKKLDPQRNLSWIIHSILNPVASVLPGDRRREEEMPPRKRREQCGHRGEIRVKRPQTKECWGRQKLEEARKEFSQKSSPMNTLISDFRPPEL